MSDPQSTSAASPEQPRQIQVVVTGDVTMDWNLARISETEAVGQPWKATDSIRIYGQAGGAALLGSLIEEIADELKSLNVFSEVRSVEVAPVQGGDKHHSHSYAIWRLFDSERGKKGEAVWRVADFMGLDPPSAPEWRTVEDLAGPDLVVLDDANLGFRSQAAVWPQAVKSPGQKRPWVLLKMAHPVAQGDLWSRLYDDFADRLIVVMAINDLRQQEVHVSRALSWEKTAQGLVQELRRNPPINALSRCAHVVISLGTEGAFLLSNPRTEGPAPAAAELDARLFFDPEEIEGTWAEKRPGGVIGYTLTLTAALACQILRNPDSPNLGRGVQRGLAAIRKLHLDGYGQPGAVSSSQARLAFPIKAIAAEVIKEDEPFPVAEVPEIPSSPAPGAQQSGVWTILGDAFPEGMEALAEQIVLEGERRALRSVPLGRFGGLLTVDRQEIEGYRSIGVLIEEYCRNTRLQTPLSVAVFGAPGSGKSFGITEMAKSLASANIEKRTFNLSQFERPDQLLGAFHQVRDLALSGKMPLVFWDEFDSSLGQQPLGWLAYFLSPMQDGTFQEGQITHPIGRAIFVFAGGTCERMEDFGNPREDSQQRINFRDVKGPDFVSRLKGYINVLGPNPCGNEAGSDPYYVIRRALLLRSMLLRQASRLVQKTDGRDVLDIDPGVLRAFLFTRKYNHGARSMEAITAMSSLAGRTRFERSCLPPTAQLALHVDEVDFMDRVTRTELDRSLLEQLARAIHQEFCNNLRRQVKTEHSSLVDFDDLPEDEKAQNRGNARDLVNKLAAAGYLMIRARTSEPPFRFSPQEVEPLAEMEHERWLRMKLNAGWRWAEKTDKPRKRHKDLVLWKALSPEERLQKYKGEADHIGPGDSPRKTRKRTGT